MASTRLLHLHGLFFSLALLLPASSARALDPESAARTVQPALDSEVSNRPHSGSDQLLEKLWKVPVIYQNSQSNWLNEFRLTGRLQFDEYQVDSDLGADQDWIIRRMRIGFQAKAFKHLTAHVEVDFDPQFADPAYTRLTDAYLSWKFSDALRFTVGKQSAKFTLDGSTSSTELLTPERNNLSNNFWFTQEYIPGVTLAGASHGFVYQSGFFSGGTASKEFGNFDSGNFWLNSLGYDFGHMIGAKKALVRADYVYNQRDTEATFARNLEDIGSLVFILDEDRWGISADLSRATGFAGQGDLFGAVAMPWFNLTKKLQLVTRYTYINGDKPNSVRLNRYESFVTAGRGDEYNEFYVGLNYYFYGHRLKVQTGYTYATLHDEANDGGRYAGWSLVNAFRMSW